MVWIIHNMSFILLWGLELRNSSIYCFLLISDKYFRLPLHTSEKLSQELYVCFCCHFSHNYYSKRQSRRKKRYINFVIFRFFFFHGLINWSEDKLTFCRWKKNGRILKLPPWDLIYHKVPPLTLGLGII